MRPSGEAAQHRRERAEQMELAGAPREKSFLPPWLRLHISLMYTDVYCIDVFLFIVGFMTGSWKCF